MARRSRRSGLPGVSLGISGAFFVAFIGSLLTAVPLSPAGLGIVELGVVGVLTLAYGLPTQEATTIALVDRLISVFSIIVIGSVVYLVSPIRRGSGPLAARRGERAGGLIARRAAGVPARATRSGHACTARDPTRPPGAARTHPAGAEYQRVMGRGDRSPDTPVDPAHRAQEPSPRRA